MNIAVILAGGIGSRVQKNIPKQFIKINEQPIINYSINTFLKCEAIDQLVVVCHDDWKDFLNEIITTSTTKQINIISGSNTRQASVYKALTFLETKCNSDDIILIHDSARPLINTNIIKTNIDSAKKHKAVCTVIKIVDTIIESVNGDIINSIKNRDQLFRVQTPQTFTFETIKKAHDLAITNNYSDASDDSQLVKHFIKDVHLVMGDEYNFKVTTQNDLQLLEKMIDIKNNFFDLNNIHPSWLSFLDEKQINTLNDIYNQIKDKPFNPKKENVLRFLREDLNKLKVIIVGQDPYPDENPEVATGRAFEVGTLTSWNEKFTNGSLKNILRLLYKTYYGEIIDYNDLKKKILYNQFEILPPNQLFDVWNKQHVLMLNRYLTCETTKAASHRKLWKQFSIDLANYIHQQNPDIIWFLWGNDAKELDDLINFKNKIISVHPSPLAQAGKMKFIDNPCFLETKHLINWLTGDINNEKKN